MPQRLADYRKAFANQQTTRGEGVAQIVDAHIVETCGFADTVIVDTKVCWL
ncbi:MAG: hypothetical protein Q4G14_01335 [Paracoccus sp. (in: a-proteobacteria)]|uniref:hypothetical protein n=1 Tax=Paracoccus sp. TaxID=267 RepID=UPI0026DEA7E6|nr:hypothetical protein [Paracoccus sp. (in: a-proteobacteria)]MDO5611868.1 hypothetical protein [Paracoccus sp. (in: a-proteobacteria)]